MDLFNAQDEAQARPQPLAARMRPRTLDELVGQERIIGPGKLLRRAIEADRLNSVILYGPPGCGKTSMAEVIASVTQRRFSRTSGVLANVAVLRNLIDEADRARRQDGRETILFIDEIHRFNKAQQDILLPHVESGVVTLVGATTHNPLFFINSPLTSRSLVFELSALSEEAITSLLRRALSAEEGLLAMRVEAEDNVLRQLARLAEGDARRALNALEIAALSTARDEQGRVVLDRAVVEDSIQKKVVVYDHDEDGHYDTISAFIKSVRGSDPHAAVYWLGKMLYAGEDPRFVARRLVILASEDIGNADPRGLSLATAAMAAVDFVGMPEARIILAQATTYLATAPKSNASYVAINKAMQDVESGRSLSVPRHLRNKRMRTVDAEPGADAAYQYPHDFAEHHVAQDYVPTATRYYTPDGQGYEEVIASRMQRWEAERKAAEAARAKDGKGDVA
ncbi:MAG: replication-associated recombination protein A [Verrucomicrobia bacterium]|nr:replication-associated recombination protein A [Verrucomicrobiota bacterium]